MKIQFIIVGWHFDAFPDFIDQLIDLNKNNDIVDIFWSCHKEPTNKVKENFNYKIFPNLGLEDGAYQQALDYLDIPDDTVLFLMHDDLVVKDWSFINICLFAPLPIILHLKSILPFFKIFKLLISVI